MDGRVPVGTVFTVSCAGGKQRLVRLDLRLSSWYCLLCCHASLVIVFPQDVQEGTDTTSCSRAHNRIYRLLFSPTTPAARKWPWFP